MVNNTCLQFFVSHVFPELFGHPLQVFEADLASLIIIKQPEGLQNLFLQDRSQHHTVERELQY